MASVGFAMANLDYAMANLPAVSSLAATAIPTRLGQVSSLWGGGQRSSAGGAGEQASGESKVSSQPCLGGGPQQPPEATGALGVAAVAAPPANDRVKGIKASPSSLVIVTINVLDSNGEGRITEARIHTN